MDTQRTTSAHGTTWLLIPQSIEYKIPMFHDVAQAVSNFEDVAGPLQIKLDEGLSFSVEATLAKDMNGYLAFYIRLDAEDNTDRNRMLMMTVVENYFAAACQETQSESVLVVGGLPAASHRTEAARCGFEV